MEQKVATISRQLVSQSFFTWNVNHVCMIARFLVKECNHNYLTKGHKMELKGFRIAVWQGYLLPFWTTEWRRKKQKQCNDNHVLHHLSVILIQRCRMTIISGNAFTDQIQVFSIQSDPILVLWVRSDPIQVLSVRSNLIRSRFCQRPITKWFTIIIKYHLQSQ